MFHFWKLYKQTQMSNKKQIDRIHKIISVALQGDIEYNKQKLERKLIYKSHKNIGFLL